MQFLVTGYDGKDENASERRLAVREEHLAFAKEMFDSGKWLYAVAILDDNDKMIGSTIICEFESKEQMQNEWLDKEVYISGKVWEKVKIDKCKVPSFLIKK